MKEAISPDITTASPETEVVGRKVYRIEGTNIEVAWRKFEPNTRIGDKPPNSHQAIVFLPGWGYTELSKPTAEITQALANYSNLTSWAIDTYTQRGGSHSLRKEALAVDQLLCDKGIRQTTVVGQSQGGSQAVYLAALSEKVDALILLDSMGLYGQKLSQFLPRYFIENFSSRLKPDLRSRILHRQYMKHGMNEILRQIKLAGGVHRYPHRLFEELKEMLGQNPKNSQINVPVIIVHGANDRTVEVKGIIPVENVFPKSPYVRMVVAEKMGYHGLPAFRPEQVARASLYLLSRWQRTYKEN